MSLCFAPCKHNAQSDQPWKKVLFQSTILQGWAKSTPFFCWLALWRGDEFVQGLLFAEDCWFDPRHDSKTTRQRIHLHFQAIFCSPSFFFLWRRQLFLLVVFEEEEGKNIFRENKRAKKIFASINHFPNERVLLANSILPSHFWRWSVKINARPIIHPCLFFFPLFPIVWTRVSPPTRGHNRSPKKGLRSVISASSPLLFIAKKSLSWFLSSEGKMKSFRQVLNVLSRCGSKDGDIDECDWNGSFFLSFSTRLRGKAMGGPEATPDIIYRALFTNWCFRFREKRGIFFFFLNGGRWWISVEP